MYGLMAVGASVVVAALASLPGLPWSPDAVALLLMFGLASLATSSFPLEFEQQGITITLESVPLVMAAVYLRPAEAIALGFVASAWAMRSFPRQLGRTGWFLLAYGCAGVPLVVGLVSLLAQGALDLGVHQPVLLLPALAVAAALELLNDCLVAISAEREQAGGGRDFVRNVAIPAAASIFMPTIAIVAVDPYLGTLWEAALVLAGVLFVMYFALWIANSQQVQTKRSEHLKDTFSRYVPEALVTDQLDQMKEVHLGGMQREVTVLFCDIRGFTSWSENREAEEIITELNALLTELSSAVMAHRGTLDKYTGDGLMAFWGAPLEDPDHATNASLAALDMLEKLDVLNADRVRKGQEPFAIGVGVHTGPAVVGNVGHEKRLDYTAIGDTVNLAARLEAATKDIGSVLLVSRTTVDRMGSELRSSSMRIGDIQVKGRRQPVEVFALQPRRPALPEPGRVDELDGLDDLAA